MILDDDDSDFDFGGDFEAYLDALTLPFLAPSLRGFSYSDASVANVPLSNFPTATSNSSTIDSSNHFVAPVLTSSDEAPALTAAKPSKRSEGLLNWFWNGIPRSLDGRPNDRKEGPGRAFSIEKAVAYIRDHCRETTGYCLGHVGAALAAAGFDALASVPWAKQAIPILRANQNFQEVASGFGESFHPGTNYCARVGDIAVWSGGKYGHIEMCVGTRADGTPIWMSDFTSSESNWSGLRDPSTHGQFYVFRQSREPFSAPARGGHGQIDRSEFAAELRDPKVMEAFAGRINIEVGGQGRLAQIAFAETIFNRAQARGKSLYDTVKGSYFSIPNPGKSHDPSLLKLIDYVYAKGTNITNGATGNASGSVGFGKSGHQTVAYNGERFGVEEVDREWRPRYVGASHYGSLKTEIARADTEQTSHSTTTLRPSYHRSLPTI